MGGSIKIAALTLGVALMAAPAMVPPASGSPQAYKTAEAQQFDFFGLLFGDQNRCWRDKVWRGHNQLSHAVGAALIPSV
jgi:hypothetical protein